MDNENEYVVSDLINLAFNQKPVDFQQAFNDIMTDKIAAAIDDKKLEVAQTMFNSYDENEVEQEDQEEYEEEQEEVPEEENDGEIS